LREALQFKLRASVEARDPAGYKIKADVRLSLLDGGDGQIRRGHPRR